MKRRTLKPLCTFCGRDLPRGIPPQLDVSIDGKTLLHYVYVCDECYEEPSQNPRYDRHFKNRPHPHT